MKHTVMPLLVVGILGVLSSPTRADLVAEWISFSSGLPALATGGAQQDAASLDVELPARGSFAVAASDELTLAGNQRGWTGVKLDLLFSGDTYDDFVLSFDVTGEAKNTKLPPDTIDWYLSADGGAFAYVGTNSIGVGANDGEVLSLAGNAAANAASSLVLQARFRNPDKGNGPSLTFDNIRIEAVAVPEPSAIWFLAVASIVGLGCRICTKRPA